jgi:hypothetical protein
MLRGTTCTGSLSHGEVERLAVGGGERNPFRSRLEFMKLAGLAQSLSAGSKQAGRTAVMR